MENRPFSSQANVKQQPDEHRLMAQLQYKTQSLTIENKDKTIPTTRHHNIRIIHHSNDANSLDGFETEPESDKITNNKTETTSALNYVCHKCYLCEKTFKAKMLLQKHLRLVHNVKQIKIRRRKCDITALFKCSFCEKSYSRKYDMEKHTKQQHPDQIASGSKENTTTIPSICKVISESGNVIYKCDYCQKIFRKSYNLGRHRTIHTNIKPHCCHLCGKDFRLYSNLTRHINEYHNNNRKFECTICSRVFKNKSTRDQHLNIHNDARPFICDVCGKAFRQSASLYVHKQFHTNNYPYSCTMCRKTFRRKHNLKEHALVHTGYKPFKCDRCQMAFRQKHELKRHSKCHVTVFCDRCGVSFNQARNLTMHKRKCKQSLICVKN